MYSGKSRLTSVFITGEFKLHGVFNNGESRLPDVFIIGKLFEYWGEVVNTWESFKYFHEHATIFTETEKIWLTKFPNIIKPLVAKAVKKPKHCTRLKQNCNTFYWDQEKFLKKSGEEKSQETVSYRGLLGSILLQRV
jgi:hypothetical protein